MDKPLSIMLFEDEQAECKQFLDYVDSLNDVAVVGVTNNSDTALE